MILEAVWFRKGKEVYWVDPVVNVVCDDDMNELSDIEVYNGSAWYSSENVDGGADNFIIRIKKEK